MLTPGSHPDTDVAQVHVSLPCGETQLVILSAGKTFQDFRASAQEALQRPFLRFVRRCGELMDPKDAPETLELQDQESITAIALKPCIVSNDIMYVLWCVGGSRMVSWVLRSDTSGMTLPQPDQLQCLQHIAVSGSAFAALTGRGHVVVWGHASHGGDASSVQERLCDIAMVYGNHYAFAAVSADGRVTTWGHPNYSGDSMSVRHKLHNVTQIVSTHSAFAALDADGAFTAWGLGDAGGDSDAVQCHGSRVIRLCSTLNAIAALTVDGHVFAWGDAGFGGDCREVQDQLINIKQDFSTDYAFAALTHADTVVAWGHSAFGGKVPPSVQKRLMRDKVRNVFSTKTCFGAVLLDKRLVTWGNDFDARRSEIQAQLHDIVSMYGTGTTALAALKEDLRVVAWGAHRWQGCPEPGVRSLLVDVKHICSTPAAFAALRTDGTVVTWGQSEAGGDSSHVQHALKHIVDVYGGRDGFVAIQESGTVVRWGSARHFRQPVILAGLARSPIF